MLNLIIRSKNGNPIGRQTVFRYVDMGDPKLWEIAVKTNLRKRMMFLMIIFLSLIHFGLARRDADLSSEATAKRVLIDHIADQKRNKKTPPFQIEAWEMGMNLRQPPLKIMDAIGLAPGMVVGEIGAGTGRMTMWLADRVGSSGKIYANDIDRSALEHLQRRCQRAKFSQVEIILGETEDPKLPEGMLDITFMVNVYHHLENPVPLIKKVLPSLKPDGILAIVECSPEKVEWGEEHGCASKEGMTEQLMEAGFEVIRVVTFLREDNIYIAKPLKR